MTQTDKQDFEELSIGTIAGLQTFLRNTQSQYQAGLKKEAELVAAGDHEYGELLHDAFGEVRNTANALIAGLQAGEAVSHKEAFILQQQYDDLVRLITKPRPITKPEPEPTPEPPKPRPEQGLEPKPRPEQSVREEKAKSIEREKSDLTQSKPKTGSLNIVSDDSEVIDVKDQVTADEQAKEAQTKPIKKKKRKRRKKMQLSNEELIDSSYQKSIKTVTEKSRQQLVSFQNKYPKPNKVQEMLFAEAKEGIEQLELVSKRGGLSKEKQASVAELASYVKHALDGVVEAEAIEVQSEQEKGRVPVVTEQAGEVLKENKKVKSPVSFVPTSVTGKKSSITKRPVPKRLQTLPKPDDVFEAESLTVKYLTAPKYKYFIERNYSSTKEFERLLDATITQVEADTIDQIEKWLGDLPASAFGYIKDMTIAELANFSNRSYDEVKADLQQQNVKYETFVGWRDMVDEMLEVVPDGERMKFGELFAHFMIELAMQDV